MKTYTPTPDTHPLYGRATNLDFIEQHREWRERRSQPHPHIIEQRARQARNAMIESCERDDA